MSNYISTQSKIMGMVRYFAKFNRNIGLFDSMYNKFNSLDLNKQDKELWVLISNCFNSFGNYVIVSEEYANTAYSFQDENNCRFFLPRLYLKKMNDDKQPSIDSCKFFVVRFVYVYLSPHYFVNTLLV